MNESELQNLVEKISLQFFQKPFLHKAIFNNRLRTTGGRYLLHSHNIELNIKYYNEFGVEELVGIIKHELCHYHLHIEKKGYKHQDRDFKVLLKKVGAPRHCATLPEMEAKRNNRKVITYICSKCNHVYKRKRKINTQKYVCGSCRGKLILKEG